MTQTIEAEVRAIYERVNARAPHPVTPVELDAMIARTIEDVRRDHNPLWEVVEAAEYELVDARETIPPEPPRGIWPGEALPMGRSKGGY